MCCEAAAAAERLAERLGAACAVDGGQQTAADEGSREMRAVSLRYFNVFGPRQDPSSEYSGVIARFMDVAAARASARRTGDGGEQTWAGGPSYVVYGDGRQTRDFVVVTDVVAANLLALDALPRRRPGLNGQRPRDRSLDLPRPAAGDGAVLTSARTCASTVSRAPRVPR